jgi:hypothetical protein
MYERRKFVLSSGLKAKPLFTTQDRQKPYTPEMKIPIEIGAK